MWCAHRRRWGTGDGREGEQTGSACHKTYEGLTAEQIREARPGWDLWRDGVIPGDADHPGEALAQVAARTDAVLDRVRPLLGEGDVAVVAHGHLARVLTVRRLGLDASASRLLGHPHPGTFSFLAAEDGQPFISAWNRPQGKAVAPPLTRGGRKRIRAAAMPAKARARSALRS
ncbi:histidine phosphatase family protein [Streptomyces sp. NPDC059456]|uniref:histidine phosphatase family protein n=1 Tax=Streptomyces sp. NPDC059456 TaxID=3346838 RepID=UPI0036C229B5